MFQILSCSSLSGNFIQFLFEEELKAFQQNKQLDGVSAKPKMFVLEAFLNIIKSAKVTEAQLEFLCWKKKKIPRYVFLRSLEL